MSLYTSSSQQRLLAMLMELAGHEVSGQAPSELAKALEIGASTVTRDLANLMEAGMAEQIPETGRYRLGPKLIRIAVKHMAEMERATARLVDAKNRYSREP
jgi:DNA-binding IclR family transcriptional regulator